MPHIVERFGGQAGSIETILFEPACYDAKPCPTYSIRIASRVQPLSIDLPPTPIGKYHSLTPVDESRALFLTSLREAT